jgi:hypothetical protein
MLTRARTAIVALVVGLAVGLGACGSISRPPDGVVRLVDARLAPAADPRIRASDTQRLQTLATELVAHLDATDPTAILALSGGGANGAYGAGVLVGWTDRGDRPTFGVVTGVSTGALAAPFAFLGSDWDDELESAYTDGQTQGLLSWRSFAAFFAPSVFSPADLRDLVEAHVTPELLAGIAREHAKGRRLLVATTDLDAQETVIWDMGMVATQGGPQGLRLFQDILIASASIPGVFPPVLIAGVDERGRLVQTMHVDGGVNTPFLGVPEGLLDWTPGPRAGRGPFHVLVNGQIVRSRSVTPGRLRDILGRSYDSMSKATLRTQLAATAGFAERSGMPLLVAAIPAEVETSSLDFSPDSMRALFDLGRGAAARGEAWRPFTRESLPSPTAVEPPPVVIVSQP